MHKLTPPAADCPKCGCEHGFIGHPRYREMIGGADGISGVIEWECEVCGYAQQPAHWMGKCRCLHRLMIPDDAIGPCADTAASISEILVGLSSPATSAC